MGHPVLLEISNPNQGAGCAGDKKQNNYIAATRFDRVTSGLWAPRATTAPCCSHSHREPQCATSRLPQGLNHVRSSQVLEMKCSMPPQGSCDESIRSLAQEVLASIPRKSLLDFKHRPHFGHQLK